MAKIIEGSEPAAVGQLALFTQPATQVSVKRSFNQENKPIAPLNSNDVISFRIPGSPLFTDLSRTWLRVTVALVMEDGSDIPAKIKKTVKNAEDKSVVEEHEPLVASVNMPLWSLFKTLNVFFGTEQVYSAQNFNYLMYMLSVLNYGGDAKRGVLRMAGYEEERPSATDYKTRNSLVFQKHKKRFARSRHVELRGRLMGGIFGIKRYLPPNINMTFDFHQTSDKLFVLDYDKSSEEIKVRRKLIDAKLITHHIDVLDSISLALEEKNRSTVFRFPYNNIFVRTLYIGKGVTEAPFHEITNKNLPTSIVCALVKADGFSGNTDYPPYVFEPYNVEEFYLQAGDMIVPATGTIDRFDFQNERYTAAYQRFCDFLDTSQYDGPPVDYESFGLHTCLFCFDLSPTSSAHRQLKRQGTTQAYIRFGTPLPHGLQLISLIETQDQLDIDFSRSITQEGAE